MTAHVCHAIGCSCPVPARMFMCFTHWRMVDSGIQRKICQTFRKEQLKTKMPSPEWLKAANAAIKAVAFKEGKGEWFEKRESGMEGAITALRNEMVALISQDGMMMDPPQTKKEAANE